MLADTSAQGQEVQTCWRYVCAEQRCKCVNPYAVKCFAAFLASTGYRRFISKSDGEAALVALKTKAVAEAANGMLEAVPKEPRDIQKREAFESSGRNSDARNKAVEAVNRFGRRAEGWAENSQGSLPPLRAAYSDPFK